MTASRILSSLMMLLGVSAIAIGLSIFVLGPTATGHASEWVYDQISHGSPPFSGPFSATADSELRFYAPFWIAYGAILILTARDLRRLRARVPLLSGMFFAGGVGRAIAYWRAGPPHPAFVALMVIELILPLLFMLLWSRRR